MSKPTKKQLADVREYLENGAEGCPFCGEEINTQRESDDFDGGSVWTECHCNGCNKDWQEISTLTGIAVRRGQIGWIAIEPLVVVDSARLQALLDCVSAMESAHVVASSPAAEEAIRRGVEAAQEMREEVSSDE